MHLILWGSAIVGGPSRDTFIGDSWSLKPAVNRPKVLALPPMEWKKMSVHVGRYTGCSTASLISCSTWITSVISDEGMGECSDSSPVTFGN